MSERSFFAELKRRNVYRAAAFYAAASWLLVQIATQVFPFFDIPNWSVRLVVVAVIIGFPIAMLFSWFYELTPQGIKRESDVEPEDSIRHSTGRKLDRWIIAVLGLAVVLLLVNTFVAHKDASPAASAPATTATAPAVTAAPAKSIAVLPFTDLSPGHDQEYFSDGMAEELLNALAKVKDLKVAGRTSSFHFKGKNDDLRAIGQALDVANVLEGSVRKQGSKVRITAQLIQASDGFHLWSETYDGDMTDVFELQERIARSITDELKVVLQGDQQKRLVQVATNNPEAYALYLRATTIFNHRDGPHFADAISALKEAIELDPKFARAHSRLAALYAVASNYTRISAEEAFAACEHEAQVAIELDPALAEPHAALALIYVNYRRQWTQAHVSVEHAVALDPQDANANFWRGTILIDQGYLAQGISSLDRALAIDPLLPNALGWRGSWYLYRGDLKNARRMLQQSVDEGLSFGEQRLALLAHAEGHDQEAAAYFARGARGFLAGFPDDASLIIGQGIYGDAAARTKAMAMIDAYLASKPRTISGGAPWALLLLGESARALKVAQDAPTSNDALFFDFLWSPAGAAARKLPQFPEFARKVGFNELWDKYGAPDECQRSGQGDYVCE